MGKKGREIVNVNIDDLHTELSKAYADEWIAYYYCKGAATVVAGRGSPNVAKELERIAEEEEHAEELAARIRGCQRSSLERSSLGSQTWSEDISCCNLARTGAMARGVERPLGE